MTTYDSTVDTGSGALGADVDATRSRLAQTMRTRPVATSATTVAVAAVTAAAVFGGRKMIESRRRPRSRWQRLLDRVR